MCFDAAPIHVERITRSGCCDDVGDSPSFVFDPKGWKYHVEGASWLKFGNGDLMGGEMAVLSPMMCYRDIEASGKVEMLSFWGRKATDLGTR